jgi:hypothetical protein
MPDPITPQLAAELSRPVTLPGYLIQMDLDGITLRYSTRGVQTFNGELWTPSPWLYRDGMLTIQGGDPVIASILLSHDLYNRRVRVWMFYGETVTPETLWPLFDGVIDGMPQAIDNIVLRLWQTSAATVYAPRGIINREAGFSVLPAPGLTFEWNGVIITFGESRG